MKRKFLLFLFLIIPFLSLQSQCLQVLDGTGAFTDTPYFISCTPGNFTIFIQPDRNIGPYVINWGDGSPNSTGTTLLTTGNVAHTYVATTDTFNITITDNGSGCTIMGVAVLERNPLASIQLPAGDDNFGCTPIQFRFVNSSTQVSQTTTFTWDFGDGTPVEIYGDTNLGDTVFHNYLPGVGVQSCNLNVTLTATNYCGASTATFFPLRVWDLDEAMITPSATLLCYPDTVVQYTNSTVRNCFPEGNQSQRYERWNFGNYWGLGQDSIIDWRPWNPPITPPPPIAYPGVGFYTVTLIDSSFCGLDTTTLTIQITNAPTAVITANPDTICEGESITFTNTSIGGANDYEWNFDLGAGFQNLNGNPKTRTYNSAGDYTVQLVAGIAGAQGCRDTAMIDIHVLPSPNADFTIGNDNECDSMTVTFGDASTGANITAYNWNFGNGNTFNGQNPPNQFYPNPGTYTVILTVTNNRGCTDTETKTVTVRETPVAAFTTSSVCLNQAATFTDVSTSGLDPITSYQWTFGDGATSTQPNPTHLYTAFGTYTVTQIVNTGFCADTTSMMVTVENRPTAAFTATPKDGCSRLTVNYTNQSSANAASFRWNFGDGSSPIFTTDTSHTFENSGISDTTYITQLIATTAFGCSDTTYDTVSVFPVPVPSFTSDAIVDCGPLTVNFTNTTQGDSLNYFWNFGDGSAVVNDTNPTHIFNNTTLFISNYDVDLVVVSSNGCRDTTTQTVTVYPEPVFTFSVIPDSGCSPLSVTFPSVVGAVSYLWDFGDGGTASGPTPTHTYVNNTTNNQTYTVRLIAQNSFGCLDTTFGSVLVFPNPTADFSLDTNRGCQPLPIQISNNSTGGNSFLWDFGDSTNSTTTNATFVKSYDNLSALTRFYNLQLIVETNNGCRDTATDVIQVHPFIQAAYLSDTVGCSPLAVSFTNQSFGAAAYSWTFGDGGNSTATNPNYIYDNATAITQMYLARMIATSSQGCLDTAERNIQVYPKPNASYTLSTNTGCQPLEVTFTNASTLADSCIWNYGDLDTFRMCTPTNMHTYTNTTSLLPIIYTSSLIVISGDGCLDTLERDITVNPQIIARFDSDTAGCSPLPVNFTNQSVGAQNFQWAFGDGGTATTQNTTNTYVNTTLSDMTYTARLIARSQYGCNDTLNRDIEVFAKPIANFTINNTSGCHPLPVRFANTSSIADSCSWNFGDGSAIVDSCFVSNIHTYNNTLSSVPVNRIAELIVFTNRGCSDTINRQITINPDVQAAFSSIDTGCSPLRVDFQNQSTGAQFFEWTFGDGGNSPQIGPTHFFFNSGLTDTIFTTKLKVTSAFGCTDSLTTDVLVYPKPLADYTIDINDGCQPLAVEFTNNSTIADSCAWDYGDGNILADCSPILSHTYTNTLSLVPVNYQSELIVVTNNGCADTLARNINVRPQVIADFSSDSISCSPLDATFRSQSFGAILYSWDFGDGTVGSGPIISHRFTNTGAIDSIYSVRLIAQSLYNCNDTIFKDVTVRPTPLVGFTATPLQQLFPSSTVNVTNTTNQGNWMYEWNFGDTTTSTLPNPGSHTYQRWGNYTIQLKASSPFCEDSTALSIFIEAPDPIADFGDSAVGCDPLEVSFQDRSQYAASHLWDFGDGITSTETNPTHTYFNAGSYNVRLRVTGFDSGKQDEIIKTNYIEVYKTPTAIFINNRDKVFIPNDPVVFSNFSNDADTYLWDFGDGNTSMEESPTYFYQEEGEFLVSLIAITNEGCRDTAYAPAPITAELAGRIRVPNAFTPNPNGPNGGSVNRGVPLSGQLNDVFYAIVDGSVKYELNIFNKWGELLFVSKSIHIGWDGYYKGELSQQDVYVWKVKVEYADGTTEVKVGDLMLLR